MFTPTIISKNFSEGVLQVLVSFSDGAQTVSKAFNVTLERNLNNEIKRETNRLNELSALNQALSLGAYDTTETPPVPPTQNEIDKAKWFRDFNRLERVTKLRDLGGMPANWSTDLTALANTVQANAKKAYIADM